MEAPGYLALINIGRIEATAAAAQFVSWLKTLMEEECWRPEAGHIGPLAVRAASVWSASAPLVY
jgi:hypothetical protein